MDALQRHAAKVKIIAGMQRGLPWREAAEAARPQKRFIFSYYTPLTRVSVLEGDAGEMAGAQPFHCEVYMGILAVTLSGRLLDIGRLMT